MDNERVSIFKFNRMFREYYEHYFSDWKVSSLVKQEDILSHLIDSDLFCDFVLADEVILLYDLVRDECVRRLAMRIEAEED